jgi:uncharacterized protein (UPF0332 family)
MKPEQGGLPRKAEDSLNAAKLMQQNGYYDFAASRAYYTMFYLAEAFLLEYGLAFSKRSAVIAAFGERFTKTGLVPAELHRYLTEGQESRNVGDHHFGSTLTGEEAALQITHAERFLEVARERLGPMPPPREEP